MRSNIKMISDTSSDIYELDGYDYVTVPMKIATDTQEFVDMKGADPRAMYDVLREGKSKSRTSCPSSGEWLAAFDEDRDNLCFTISSNLSGSNNAAHMAKQMFEEENEHHVEIVDSYSTGPENDLLIEKAVELMEQGLSVKEIKDQVEDYGDSTHVYFVTSSVNNLVNNGRIPSFVGKAISILKINLIGIGTNEGRIKIVSESRNPKKALQYIVDKMVERGYQGGKIRINHCYNEKLLPVLLEMLKERFGDVDLQVRQTGLLCSYYVEEYGIIIAFEGNKED